MLDERPWTTSATPAVRRDGLDLAQGAGAETAYAAAMIAEPELARRLGPGLLTLYGVGTTIGAGIYVLIGEVAGLAGYWTPVAFVLAGLAAAASATSPGITSTATPCFWIAVRMAISMARGIWAGLDTLSQ